MALVACAAAGWVYLLSQPVGIGSLLAFLIGAASSLLAAVMLLVALAYYTMSYRLDGDQLIISCLWLREIVPLGQIEGVYRGKRLGRRVRVEGINWRGIRVGHLLGTDFDRPAAYTTAADPAATLVLTTRHRSYAITPAALEGFRGQLVGRLESLPEEAIQASTEPISLGSLVPSGAFRRDSVFLWLIGAAALILLAASLFVINELPGLPATLPLHLNSVGQPDFVVARSDVLRLPIIGLLILGVNSLAAALIHAWQRDVARLLAAATLVVELIGLIAVLRLVR